MEKVLDEKHSVTDEIRGLPEVGDRISWKAVIAGGVIAMAIQLLLTSLGLAIGIEVVDPFIDKNPMDSVGTGTGIWLGISSLISLFAGSYVAGRFSKSVSKFGGVVHGVLTWSLVLAASFLLASTALGKIYGGFTSLLSGAGSLVATGVEKIVPDDVKINTSTLATAQEEISQLLRQTGASNLRPEKLGEVGQDLQAIGTEAVKDVVTSPGDAVADLNQALDKAYNRTDQVVADADKEALATALAARTGLSKAQASQTVDRWSVQYKKAKAELAQAKKKAEELAFDASRALEMAAWIAFAAALISLIAAALGGLLGHGHDPQLKVRRTYHDKVYRNDTVVAYDTTRTGV